MLEDRHILGFLYEHSLYYCAASVMNNCLLKEVSLVVPNAVADKHCISTTQVHYLGQMASCIVIR